MADWNNPQTGQTYTNHFAAIRDKDNALAKMFDGTSETNLPDGAIKINAGSKYRLEKWDASASSWNTVIPGLGNLTQAEVDVLDGLTASTSELNKLDGLTATTTELNQIAEIGSTTISSTQWGYLGGLDQNLRTTDSPDFGGTTISSTQYGYLGGLGSAPLEDDDLAANGGNIPEVNAGATITSSWTFQSSSDFLRFNRDGATRLFSFSQTSSGRFDIRDETAGIGRILIDPDGGVFGSNAGGSQGADTINFAKVYDNGNRVLRSDDIPQGLQSGGTWSVSENSTKTIPAGAVYLSIGGNDNVSIQFYIGATGWWPVATDAGQGGFIISDGSNFRINNNSQTSVTIYYRYLNT